MNIIDPIVPNLCAMPNPSSRVSWTHRFSEVMANNYTYAGFTPVLIIFWNWCWADHKYLRLIGEDYHGSVRPCWYLLFLHHAPAGKPSNENFHWQPMDILFECLLGFFLCAFGILVRPQVFFFFASLACALRYRRCCCRHMDQDSWQFRPACRIWQMTSCR